MLWHSTLLAGQTDSARKGKAEHPCEGRNQFSKRLDAMNVSRAIVKSQVLWLVETATICD